MRTARSQGLLLPEGWIAFLESAGGEPLYGGPPEGARLVVKMEYGRPRIPRLLATVNGAEIFAMDMSPAIAANPFVSFFAEAKESGTVVLRWTGDEGFAAEQRIDIAVE